MSPKQAISPLNATRSNKPLQASPAETLWFQFCVQRTRELCTSPARELHQFLKANGTGRPVNERCCTLHVKNELASSSDGTLHCQKNMCALVRVQSSHHQPSRFARTVVLQTSKPTNLQPTEFRIEFPHLARVEQGHRWRPRCWSCWAELSKPHVGLPCGLQRVR